MTLDQRHATHNIPGKLLTYLKSGLPILAIVNPGNDLLGLLAHKKVGIGLDDAHLSGILIAFNQIQGLVDSGSGVGGRCQGLANELFNPRQAVSQITQQLDKKW